MLKFGEPIPISDVPAGYARANRTGIAGLVKSIPVGTAVPVGCETAAEARNVQAAAATSARTNGLKVKTRRLGLTVYIMRVQEGEPRDGE